MSGTGKDQARKDGNMARERSARLRAEQEKAARRRKRTWLAVYAGLGAMIIGGITWGLMAKSAAKTIAGVQTYSGLSRNHVQGTVKYAQNPPTGGDHNPVWLNCGIYTAPVANENAVHSMEHGAVWITYQQNLPAAQVAQLTKDVTGKPYVILSPYKGLPTSVVASAWGTQLKLTDASDSRIAKFISTYAQGPQTPEPGAACTGGTGTPTS
jgi:Protein of unknown function (DUF3105)